MSDGVARFRCPVCRRSSANPNDVREGYCGACHWWTGVPELLMQRPDLLAPHLPCIVCEQGLADGDRVMPVMMIDDGVHPVARWQHVECQALGVVGHWFGVCSCTGFDTSSRASAVELGRRMRAAGVGSVADGPAVGG